MIQARPPTNSYNVSWSPAESKRSVQLHREESTTRRPAFDNADGQPCRLMQDRLDEGDQQGAFPAARQDTGYTTARRQALTTGARRIRHQLTVKTPSNSRGGRFGAAQFEPFL